LNLSSLYRETFTIKIQQSASQSSNLNYNFLTFNNATMTQMPRVSLVNKPEEVPR